MLTHNLKGEPMNTETEQKEQAARQDARSTGLVSCDELREICDLTIRLTELRQRECKHLCVENYAPEVFLLLLSKMSMHKRGLVSVIPDISLCDVEQEWFKRYSS